MGAAPRQMLRGYPLGSVVSVDKDAGTVSVDLGSGDGVMQGFGFVVVDEKGGEAASITAREVYSDLFWSDKVAPGKITGLRAGMQVRWNFTPEVAAILKARKDGTAGAYRDFAARFPASRFLPGLIKGLPDGMLREVNPDYYQAWKSYTKDAFQEFIKKYPGTGFASAAADEIKAIDAYDSRQEQARKERERVAAAAEKERAKREAVEQRVRDRQQKAQRNELLGKITNNSTSPVRFSFEPAGEIPDTTVLASSSMDIRATAGTYSYKVYPIEDKPGALPSFGDDAKPQPLKEDKVDIMFDFWEITYP